MSGAVATMIHPTAVIHSGARLGPNVRVGPYCIIGDEVVIEDDTELIAQVYVDGPLTVGPANRFFPYSSIGVIPQDKKFRGERTETIIGKGNTFREFVTVHRGTAGGGGLTRIGDDNWIMAYAHVAHDCIVGSHTVLANGTTLAGHVVIEDYATVGAFSGIHQYCRIGRHSIVGGYSVITQDVLPFSKTVSERETRVFGVNTVGLERHGFSQERREGLSRAFRHLISSKLNTTQAIAKIREGAEDSEEIQELLRFIETSERGFIK
ncbi:MAG: acyl-[acyl-carrier-protein]--UDP-N-acetylglucosamine O-acyltransferase [Acidobacteria bacterium RIFCSPLOWO2_02_FULL_60_20]|nr:MAG: acyl-[acyl-carrier-protein]--UDP-N-acetylglucosamine O-acyltransferase [Acidobacteria bacterium RIFCSPLOWO2_02_FULL_60_20]